jgi:hypothetical protein
MWIGLALAVAPAVTRAQSDVPVTNDAIDDGPVSAIVALASAHDEIVHQLADDGEEEGIPTVISETAPSGRYWIGLDCAPADETLRAQLALEGGLVVRAVADNSPAEAAGLQAHDVIISAKTDDGDETITNVPQLSAFLQRAEAKPVALRVVRGGKKIVATVTPAERPGAVQAGHREAGTPPGRGLMRGGPRGFRIGGPPAGAGPGKLPEKMQVTVTKRGEQVQITVAMDGNSWTVKNDELDKLPAEARSAAARLLGLQVMSRLIPHPSGGFGPFGGAFGRGRPGGPGQGPARADAENHQRARRDSAARRNVERDDDERDSDRRPRARGRHRHRADDNDCPHCRALRRHAHRHHRAFAGLHRGEEGWRPSLPPGRPFGMPPRHPFPSRSGMGFHRFGHAWPRECPFCGAGRGPAGGKPDLHRGEPAPKADLGARLERLVEHLERLHGRRPEEHHPGEPEAVEHLRQRLREVQEQQERLAESLRHIAKALEEMGRR